MCCQDNDLDMVVTSNGDGTQLMRMVNPQQFTTEQEYLGPGRSTTVFVDVDHNGQMDVPSVGLWNLYPLVPGASPCVSFGRTECPSHHSWLVVSHKLIKILMCVW